MVAINEEQGGNPCGYEIFCVETPDSIGELISDIFGFSEEIMLIFARKQAEQKVLRYLLTYFDIGKKGSFKDDQNKEHKFIIPSLPMKFLIRKISFGKTLWYNDIIAWILKKIVGDKKAITILRRTLGKRKLPDHYSDEEAIACYEILYEALSRYKAKDIEGGVSLFWQKRRVNACIWAYIRAI